MAKSKRNLVKYKSVKSNYGKQSEQRNTNDKCKDTKCRKWFLTINNPAAKGLEHSAIREILAGIKAITYWCMSDEIGENGTYHTHIFIYATSSVRFSTIQSAFPETHIDMARGSVKSNRDYIFKQGKWENDVKHGTQVPDTQEEWGIIPNEMSQGSYHALYEMVKIGLSDSEILEVSPSAMGKLTDISRTRQILTSDEYSDTFRILNVTYISGKTEAGKTRGVMEQHGYKNIYRLTAYYSGSFDGYKTQDVLMFDEFNSDTLQHTPNFKIENMLTYLDGYPLELPARYANKTACYTKVYLISNVDLTEQYKEVQEYKPEVWAAFLRRINRVIKFCDNGNTVMWERKSSDNDDIYNSQLLLDNNGENGGDDCATDYKCEV